MALIGIRKARRQFKEAPNLALQGLRKGLFIEGEKIMTAAKQMAPVDLGNLKNSGFVSLPEVLPNRRSVELTLAFGGPAGAGNQGGVTNARKVGYAVIQHEDCSLNHPGHGRCKYLQIPVNRAKRGMSRRVGRHIDAEVRKL